MENIHCVFYIFCAFYIFINELNHLIDINDILNKNKKIEPNNIIIKKYKNLTDRQQNIVTNLEINYGRLLILTTIISFFKY